MRFGKNDLAGSRFLESLGCCSIRLYLRHDDFSPYAFAADFGPSRKIYGATNIPLAHATFESNR